MKPTLISEYISDYPNSKMLVLFGDDPNRRDEVVRMLKSIDGLSIYGTLSEEEGMQKLMELGQVEIVLIDGNYSDDQRQRIRYFVKQNFPDAKITEPDQEYSYDNQSIIDQITSMIKK
jgi:DNA-binding NarL/FixJ family response regulator